MQNIKRADILFDEMPKSPVQAEPLLQNNDLMGEKVHLAHVMCNLPLDGPEALPLVHKAARRCIRWYIKPILAQQVAFNTAAVHTFDYLQDVMNSTRELEKLADEIEFDLCKNVHKNLSSVLRNNRELTQRNEEMRTTLAKLEQKVAQLEQQGEHA